VEQGRFRVDVHYRISHYRISAVSVEVPRLAERAGDLPLLVHHFLAVPSSPRRMTARRPSRRLPVPPPWPGCVRGKQISAEAKFITQGKHAPNTA